MLPYIRRRSLSPRASPRFSSFITWVTPSSSTRSSRQSSFTDSFMSAVSIPYSRRLETS